ncbi:MAG: oligosaccharide repeat unit polymerase [Pyrinomonadaceae bacterium]|nr:oligosaccharide repeat unit polymerase [Pyrinomonadaceae bacterium]
MMNVANTNSVRDFSTNNLKMLFPAAFLMAATFIVAFGIWFFSGDWTREAPLLFLMPWVFATAIVVCAPSVYLIYTKRFDFFNPLVLAAWTFFLPAFVVGSLFLSTGVVEPYLIYFIDNPQYDLPLTMFYIMLGYAGMSVGFLLPWGKQFGGYTSNRIPKWNWRNRDVLLPSFILLAIGLFFYFSAWFSGVVGYQKINLADSFSGLSFLLSLLLLEASFILAMYIFKSPRFLPEQQGVALIGFVLAILVRVVMSGSRSILLQTVIMIAMAFAYSGRKIKFNHAVGFGIFGVLALIVGISFGTTFRDTKGSEDRSTFDKQIENVASTIEILLTQDVTKTLGESLTTFATRIEDTSSLAVVVSNYEKLQPYEAAYGLDNNIWTYTWTSFIPRFLWIDKPLISDARAYSELYFNYGESSFAITSIGDLLRNFGAPGIFLGMLALGLFLRTIYATLIENQEISYGRATIYFIIIINVNYEGFYGTILPSVMRIGLIAILSMIMVSFMVGNKKLNSAER